MAYKDPEREREYQRGYREAHRAQYVAWTNAYYARNPGAREASGRAYRANHPEKIAARNAANKPRRSALRKAAAIRLKEEVFEAYGGASCACCGEIHLDFLSIDHIGGGGAKHRKDLRGGGGKVYQWLKKHGYPPGFRVLCMNCNHALGHSGSCPHGTLKNSPKPLTQVNLWRPSQNALNTATVSAHSGGNINGEGRQLNLIMFSDELGDSA